MHSFEYVLILLGGVLISSLISRRLPRISTPLVQIAIGIALTLLPISFEIRLEPELFLVLFIAPLLFEDAKKADKVALWRLKRPILLLAIGLVFTTALVVGFTIHWFTPSIPLAAAFALAAALAPTDAVAVASFKASATISDDQENLLKGESLLNDASGIVSFQFAIAAVLTGTFSLVEAGVSFLFTFFGGLIVGVIFMFIRLRLIRLRTSSTENIVFHVLFEVITPFLIYLIAETFHVSGIIAVVAAGITYSFSRRPQTPLVARHNIVSTSVWAVLSFSLNGLVFLILGTQLPSVIRRVWSSSAAADYFLIALIACILFGILLMRFIWVLIMRRKAAEQSGPKAQPLSRSWKARVHDAALLSLTGAKGAITLALVLTLPLTLADGAPFPERDLIIFLASGVILLSLLVANFIVPLIAPKKASAIKPEHEVEAVLDVYRFVITRLVENTRPEEKAASEEVVQQYYERIRKAKIQHTSINDLDTQVRVRIIEWEREHTLELIEQGTVGTLTGIFYLDHLSRILARLEHHNTVRWEIRGATEQLAHRLRQGRRYRNSAADTLAPAPAAPNTAPAAAAPNTAAPDTDAATPTPTGAPTSLHAKYDLRDLIVANYRYAQGRLEEHIVEQRDNKDYARSASLVLIELERRIARFDTPRGGLRSNLREREQKLLKVEAQALEYEREAISEALENELISRATAKEMRDNVAMMELDIEEQLE
jgi:CPA1 family monovalent cation:H+ antiporter